jgi:hypothetical protein
LLAAFVAFGANDHPTANYYTDGAGLFCKKTFLDDMNKKIMCVPLPASNIDTATSKVRPLKRLEEGQKIKHNMLLFRPQHCLLL